MTDSDRTHAAKREAFAKFAESFPVPLTLITGKGKLVARFTCANPDCGVVVERRFDILRKQANPYCRACVTRQRNLSATPSTQQWQGWIRIISGQLAGRTPTWREFDALISGVAGRRVDIDHYRRQHHPQVTTYEALLAEWGFEPPSSLRADTNAQLDRLGLNWQPEYAVRINGLLYRVDYKAAHPTLGVFYLEIDGTSHYTPNAKAHAWSDDPIASYKAKVARDHLLDEYFAQQGETLLRLNYHAFFQLTEKDLVERLAASSKSRTINPLFTPANVAADISSGLTVPQISKKYGVGTDTVNRLKRVHALSSYRSPRERRAASLGLPNTDSLIVELVAPDTGCNPRALFKKKQYYAAKGRLYIPIYESEWHNNPDLLQSMLQHLLHKSPNTRAARKLSLVSLDPTTAQTFFTVNHRQGAVGARHTYALVYPDTGDIFAAMSFGTPRFERVAEWELLRFATQRNWSIPGAAQRLLTHFERQHAPRSLLSYADVRFTHLDPTRTLYHRLGFTYTHTSSPGFSYIKDGILYSRVAFQKHRLSARLAHFDPNASERKNMLANGYLIHHDCGSHRFIKHYPQPAHPDYISNLHPKDAS